MAANIHGDEPTWERGPDFTVKTWFLDEHCESHVSTFEHQRAISGGTTGLKTWPAALAFAEYLLVNPALVRGQRVLELGSGVGMLGLVIAHLGANQVMMTDFHSEVLKMLQANINEYKDKNPDSTTDLQVRPLDWFACATPESVQSMTPEVLLCADTVYDPDLLPALAQCVRAFLLAARQHKRELNVLMATAVRRQATFDKLRETLASHGLAHLVVCAESPPVTKFPLDEVGSPIALLKIGLVGV
ncbi:putative methyltransferase-domain-containing protein [Catenaria anguillulae PL171]|uniref:Putative methyltransferase-domain-containing protein n=1 Tax=Catenaria anguillulae PL171 TaxID=765915 RepID=A0A1Y2I262_9FUNG|nr:putative methyltransferase-domain-containing protein [Catenaria anguillulae PL171]